MVVVMRWILLDDVEEEMIGVARATVEVLWMMRDGTTSCMRLNDFPLGIPYVCYDPRQVMECLSSESVWVKSLGLQNRYGHGLRSNEKCNTFIDMIFHSSHVVLVGRLNTRMCPALGEYHLSLCERRSGAQAVVGVSLGENKFRDLQNSIRFHISTPGAPAHL